MEQKPWQHGYDLDYLKQLEGRFAHYNSYAMGPFEEMKKHIIAQALHNNELDITDDYIIQSSLVKTRSPIKAYLDVIIAQKEKFDRVVSAFTYTKKEAVRKKLAAYTEPTWLWIWQEDKAMEDIAHDAGYNFVGSKITSFSEIKGLYFKDRVGALFPRAHPNLHELEYRAIVKSDVIVDVTPALQALENINQHTFTNHYSNYNKKRSWSALSLRGYTADPGFITKPSEMNKKWQEEHKNDIFELQDTPLRAQLPELEKVFSFLSNITDLHRIRFMRLAPGGGELQRHTDQVDKDTGVADGKLMRFHIPIITNPKVIFTTWDFWGDKVEVNMTVGGCWYLDTRKPHMAVNHGDKERVHLVIDAVANKKVRDLVLPLAFFEGKNVIDVMKV